MTESEKNQPISASFRDPSGVVFRRGGSIFRQVNLTYREEFDFLVQSGLYRDLVDSHLLIPHEETDTGDPAPADAYKLIKPEIIPFISYPYEWCFSQLKDAALTTLAIQRKSLDHGMSLKDCSAYNVQFKDGNPIFIDTLSFERYDEGRPWVAYRQFCQHFLAPLALMSCRDIRLGQLLRVYIDGIPLDLAASLLPFHTRLNFSLLVHIYLHAKAQKHFAAEKHRTPKGRVTRLSLIGLVDSLESAVRKMTWRAGGTEWSDYYDNTNYSEEGFHHKMQIVSDFMDRLHPKVVWDIGANVGTFSRLAAVKQIPVIAFDIDPSAVEKNYLRCAAEGEKNILPLLLDLTNPSPGIGWNNNERMSWRERGPTDAVLALALIHHLAIANNLPLNRIAEFFCGICSTLMIEFVPKEDSQTRRLLSARKDIFPNYTQQNFEDEFGKGFHIQATAQVRGSGRVIYLMERKPA
jgi:hypothetical protein